MTSELVSTRISEQTSVPHLDIKLTTKGLEALKTSHELQMLVSLVRPHWNWNDTDIEPVTGGFINHIIRVRLKHDTNNNDSLLVRVTGERRVYVLDPADEIEGIKIASVAGCTPPVYATFNNGFVQKFINVVSTDYVELFQEENCRKIGTLIATLHSLKSKYEAIKHINKESILFRKIKIIIDAIPDESVDDVEIVDSYNVMKSEGLTKTWLYKELEILEKFFNPGSMKLVFCQTDAHRFNFIKEKENGCFYAVDFEFCGMNYDAYVFVFFKYLHYIFKTVGLTSKWTPSNNDYRRLIHDYMKARQTLEGQDCLDVREDDIDEFQKNMLKITPIYLLYAVAFYTQELFFNVIRGFSKDFFKRMFRRFCAIYRENRHHMVPETFIENKLVQQQI